MISYLGYLKYYLFIIVAIIFCLPQLYSQGILGNDTLICASQYITLNAGPNGPYLWSTGETTSSIRVYQGGDYSVTAAGITDTVKVTIYNESYNQASKWTFGNGISIKFDTTAQSDHKASDNPLTNSFSFPAGSATAVNNNGNLLFFTDGESLFDSTGKVFETNLAGDKTIAQNSLIVPKPGSAVDYYIFTIKDHTLSYSIAHIDGNKNVTLLKKNIVLANGVDDKFGGINNTDNTGFWLMSHKQNSNTFQAFLLTKDGIEAPILSNSGSVTNDAPGYLKFSPDGTRLAIASDFTEVFYFNNATGKVDSPKHLFYTSSYGLEFSANSNYLYVTSTTNTKTDSAGPTTSGGALLGVNIAYGYKTDVIIKGTPATTFGALQMAPDGKIYFVQGNNSSSCLGTIKYPSGDDVLTTYTQNALCVSGTTTMGLPNFPQHYFTKSSNFFFIPNLPCEGDSMRIIAASRLLYIPYAKFSLKYTFGDPASGSADTSTELMPKHLYPGKELVYKITSYTKDICKADTIRLQTFIIPRPRLSMKDTVVCPEAPPIILNAGNKYSTVDTDYLWILDKDTLGIKQEFTPLLSGKYRLEVRIGGQCDTSGIFNVTFKKFPPFDLGPEKKLCDGDTSLLFAPIDLPSASMLWSTNETSKRIIVKTSGTYWLQLTDQGCSISDTLQVSYFPRPADPLLKKDCVSCFGTTVLLDALNKAGFQYSWSTGEISESITATKPGRYDVTIYNPGCRSIFSSNIVFMPPLSFPTDNPSTICEKDNQQIELDAGTGAKWEWSPGKETSRKISLSKPGTYSVTKKDTLSGCSDTKEFVIYNLCTPRIYFPTSFTPNDDGANETFKPLAKNVISYQLTIYNRWGELIYFSQDLENGWDGTYKGVPSPIDDYIYTVTYEGEGIQGNAKFSMKGSLLLLR